MMRYIQLFRADSRHVWRDPLLAFGLAAPLLLSAVLRFGLPVLETLLEEKLGLRLTPYSDVILSVALLMIPLMLGMLSGFMMLDERDENVISYYAITPLRKKGYLGYRLTLPSLITGAYTLYLLPASGLPAPPGHVWLPLFILLVLEAPIIGLFLTAFAANKIEGLALSKAAGIIALAPLAVYLLPEPWQLLLVVIPTYWPARLVLMDSSVYSLSFWLTTVGGLLCHAILLKVMYRRFSLKAD